jgi:hypothetical protein
VDPNAGAIPEPQRYLDRFHTRGLARPSRVTLALVIPFVSFVPFVPFVPFVQAKPAQELIERTLAIVGGQVITLSDVRTAVALRLVETDAGADPIDSALSRLIDRALMLREVQHYAPPEPLESAVDQRVAFSRERFPTAEAFQAVLDAGGFSDERLRAWVRDDLRLAAYLDQRFAAAGLPSDQEVSAYYNEHRSEFDQGGVSFAEAAPLIRERLAGERRRELITDWLSDLRRRTEVVRISDLQIADCRLIGDLRLRISDGI